MTYEKSMPIEESANSGDREPEITLPPQPVWVQLAFAFTLLFMAIHLYWAVGGTWGLPLLALQEKAAVQAVNWVVSVIMVIGALFVLALNHPIGRRVPSWTLLVPLWTGAVVCVSHAIYGLITKALYLSGWHGAVNFPVVAGVSPATAAAENRHSAILDILVFEPCFLIQGLLLALAAWQFIRTPAGRRRWRMSLIAGIALIDVFGLLLDLAGKQFAIS
ncbi:DUF3995 domain-containing protein [Streptomyces scopuliridis]|uniref:DUF3995 domain-containing protein n=1 Tax=Streptomyces scopuliridis TaxID=452529 RepID=A0ACD4ZDT8_9ACTN|nr:DUF3995 domain-containing protein [Streptomyces scopuliridis]WSB31700.1 DUF3995 domain-containing protein [Streptomyces scopuliridis]WSB95947.1 DUF3995 domain-containing protein [Streptomyces scopuliridis]WSC10346.1 DUF3995 domain-containing protein [Streptomyces scopuliridis]